MTGPLPSSPLWDTVVTERDTQLLADLRRASAVTVPRSTVCRYAAAWGESHEGAPKWSLVLGHPPPISWPLTACRSSKGSDRNTELKQRLQLL